MNARRAITLLSCVVLVIDVLDDTAFAEEVQTRPVSFRSEIAPIMLDHCLACHGAKKAEGGYRVDSYAELVKAGDSGELPIAASPEQGSELLRRITCMDESERMPAESEPLSQEQIELVKQWVAGGGKFDGEDASLPLGLVIPPAKYSAPPDVYAQPIPITANVLSPDGKFLITGGYHEVIVWNLADGKLVRRIANIGQRVFAMAFSADGVILAVGCGEPGRSGEVRLVDFGTGEIKGVVARTNDVVLDIAFRPGTSELAVASADSTIRIVNSETLEIAKTIASHADWVTAVGWSDDGSLLASASRDKSAKVYDGTSGELLASYLRHGAAVRGVSVLSENKQVVSVGADHQLHRWNVDDGKKVAEIAIQGDGFRLTRDGTQLYVPCSDSRLLQIDLSNNKILQEFKGHRDWVLSASYQANVAANGGSGVLVSGSFDGQVCVWNPADAKLIRNWLAKP